MTQKSVAGQMIDRYIVEGELGSGGFGEVYRARHSVLGTEVALKVLSPQHSTTPGMVERFLREAQLAAGIGNPHIVGVHDAGVTKEGQPFLALELLEGEDLEQRLRRVGPMRTQEALDTGAQILEGLGAAHAAGIVHRDMKPANVFLTPSPDGRPFVKLLDFGISKVLDPTRVSSLTQTGMMLGTPAYMAPEQMQDTRGVDHRVDLYATAAILFEAISGRLPYAAETFADLMSRVQGVEAERLDQHASVPPALAELIAKGLARDPAMRFQSAQEMREAIDAHRVTRSLPSPPKPVTPAPLSQQSLIGTGVTPAMGRFPSQPQPQYGLAPPSAATPPPMQPPTYGAPQSGYGSSGYGSAGYTPPPGSYPGHTPPPHGSSAGYGPPSSGYGPPPSMGYAQTAPAEGSSKAMWGAVIGVLILLPLACIGGGVLAFGLSDDSGSSETTETSQPPPPQNPVLNPPSTPSTPLPPIAPTPPPRMPPPPPRPTRPDWSVPPVAAEIPAGADPCTIPVTHAVACDREYTDFIPPVCEIRRGRELHVIGSYRPDDEGRTIVDIARTAAPIVLVLSAYTETHFVIRVAEGVQLEEVHTVGYNHHTVEGLPPGVRHEDHGRRRFPIMGWEWREEGDSWSGYETAEAAERETGAALRAYAGCYAARHWVLGQRAP